MGDCTPSLITRSFDPPNAQHFLLTLPPSFRAGHYPRLVLCSNLLLRQKNPRDWIGIPSLELLFDRAPSQQPSASSRQAHEDVVVAVVVVVHVLMAVRFYLCLMIAIVSPLF